MTRYTCIIICNKTSCWSRRSKYSRNSLRQSGWENICTQNTWFQSGMNVQVCVKQVFGLRGFVFTCATVLPSIEQQIAYQKIIIKQGHIFSLRGIKSK